MNEHDATEIAYKKGYRDAVKDMHHKIWLEFSDCLPEETVTVESLRSSVDQISEELEARHAPD